MLTRDEIQALEEKIVHVVKNIYDPEVPVNIYELGLIYEVKVFEDGKSRVVMTLTAPNCPVAESLPAEVKEEIGQLNGITEVDLEITFDPPWNQDMMSDEAKLELGML